MGKAPWAAPLPAKTVAAIAVLIAVRRSNFADDVREVSDPLAADLTPLRFCLFADVAGESFIRSNFLVFLTSSKPKDSVDE